MNKFIYLLFFSAFIMANPFNKWVDQNKHIIEEKIKTVSFQATIERNTKVEEKKIFDGKFIIGEDKQFRFEMGHRTVVSDGAIWQSYDDRTDQIFIQEPDKKLEKALFSWVRVKKLKSLPIKNEPDGSYKINFFGKNNDVRAYFNMEKNVLDSIIISQGDGLGTKIFNISLAVADSMILTIGTESATFFDLR